MCHFAARTVFTLTFTDVTNCKIVTFYKLLAEKKGTSGLLRATSQHPLFVLPAELSGFFPFVSDPRRKTCTQPNPLLLLLIRYGLSVHR